MTKKSPSAASSPSSTMEGGSGAGRFVCSMCSKVYRSGAGLRYHKRKRHRVGEGVVEPTALHRVKCQEPGCTYQMLAISDLRNHLANHHQKPEYKCTEEKKFTSLADFTDWKSSFETRTESKYVKNCGAKGKSDNQTTEYYYCNRTGPFGQGLRRNKIQGSLRSGIHCTSSMKVEIQNDEHITVQYYPAHYGHNNIFNSEDSHLSENSITIGGGGVGGSGGGGMGGMNGNSSSNHLNGHQQQENSHYSINAGDRSSSSSPGSSSTSPSGGSNSNSNHLPILSSTIDRPSMNLTNSSTKTFIAPSNHQNFLQNQMSHCIIISPSFVDVEHPSLSHSNHQSTPVLVVHQPQLTNPQISSLSSSSSTTTTAAIMTPSTPNLPVKKEKSVSDIMHEAFNILSYWPIDHHHGLVTSENESQIIYPQVNMDEHLMF